MSLMVFGVMAESVTVRVKENSEEGQAYIFRLSTGCFAAMPAHIVEGKGANAGLLLPVLAGGNKREAQGTAPVRPDPELDLAFFRVAGGLALPICGSPENLGHESLDAFLPTIREATLQVRRIGTTVQQIPLTVVKYSQTYIYVRPVRADQYLDTLGKTVSGGAVVDGAGVPLGMITDLEGEDGLGRALRFDVIRRLAYQALQNADLPSVSSSKESGAFQVREWTGVTLDASNPAPAVLRGGIWQVEPVNGVAGLVIVSAEKNRVVSRVLVSRATEGFREPDVLTIRRASREQGDFVLLKVCGTPKGDTRYTFDCAFVPTDLGILLLEFGIAGHPHDRFSIGPINLR